MNNNQKDYSEKNSIAVIKDTDIANLDILRPINGSLILKKKTRENQHLYYIQEPSPLNKRKLLQRFLMGSGMIFLKQ